MGQDRATAGRNPFGAKAPPEWFADFLRSMAQFRLNANGDLGTLKLGDAPYRPVAEFWAEYDAQQAAGKK